MPKDQLLITDRAAARFVLDPGKRAFLAPFMNGGVTISEAANRLGVKLNLMAYYVHRMTELGLLERNLGASGKCFRAAAHQLLIPFANTRYETFGAMLHELAQMKQFTDYTGQALGELAQNWGIVFRCDNPSGAFEMSFAPIVNEEPSPIRVQQLLEESRPAFWVSGDTLCLDYPQAKALQRELFQLLLRYKEQNVAKGQPYILLLGLTPITPQE